MELPIVFFFLNSPWVSVTFSDVLGIFFVFCYLSQFV